MGRTLISPLTWSDEISNPATTPDKIRVFKERVIGWMLEPTEQMEKIAWSGYARLAVLMSYFEMIGQYREGKIGPSGEFFEKGFLDVYPGTSLSHGKEGEIRKKLYDRVRCGLYHTGGAKLGVLIHADFSPAVSYDSNDNTVRLNPDTLLDDIVAHFQKFVADLVAGTADMQKFVDRFDIKE